MSGQNILGDEKKYKCEFCPLSFSNLKARRNHKKKEGPCKVQRDAAAAAAGSGAKEELETKNGELQTKNEELQTKNGELEARVEELEARVKRAETDKERETWIQVMEDRLKQAESDKVQEVKRLQVKHRERESKLQDQIWGLKGELNFLKTSPRTVATPADPEAVKGLERSQAEKDSKAPPPTKRSQKIAGVKCPVAAGPKKQAKVTCAPAEDPAEDPFSGDTANKINSRSRASRGRNPKRQKMDCGGISLGLNALPATMSPKVSDIFLLNAPPPPMSPQVSQSLLDVDEDDDDEIEEVDTRIVHREPPLIAALSLMVEGDAEMGQSARASGSLPAPGSLQLQAKRTRTPSLVKREQMEQQQIELNMSLE